MVMRLIESLFLSDLFLEVCRDALRASTQQQHRKVLICALNAVN
jgi:hypothetical protein